MIKFNKKILLKISAVLVFIICLLVFGQHIGNAQVAPNFLVSWRAENYVPSWYTGKDFPTNGTTVSINFELLDNSKVVNISKLQVRWYVNDNLVKNESDGLGISSIRFATSDSPGDVTEVRISIVDYKGQQLNKIIDIPVVAPEAVINAPYSDLQISTGQSAFESIPFFFNVPSTDSLSFSWSVNGQPAQESMVSAELLNLNIDPKTPSSYNINPRVAVQNLLNPLESALGSIQLTVK